LFGFASIDFCSASPHGGIWDWADEADKADFCGLTATYLFLSFLKLKK